MKRVLAVVGLCVGLAGCLGGEGQRPGTSLPLGPDQFAPLSAIKEEFRCNLALYMTMKTDFSPDPNAWSGMYISEPAATHAENWRRFIAHNITLSLGLSGVAVNSRGGSAGFSVPLAGVKVGPSIGGEASATQKTALTLDLTVDATPLTAEDVMTACHLSSLDGLSVDDYPLVRLLQEFERAVYDNVPKQPGNLHKPWLYPAKLVLATGFEVKKTVSGGIKLSFLVFTIGSTVAESESYGQVATIVFDVKGSGPALTNQ
jgi:hypothetical protein